MKITSNNRERELQPLYAIPFGIATAWFDYIPKEEWASPRLFQYRGSWYDANEFERVQSGGELESCGWHGHQAQSFFDAVLIRYNEDFDAVVVGHYTE